MGNLSDTQTTVAILIAIFMASIAVCELFIKAREKSSKIHVDFLVNNYSHRGETSLLFRLTNFGYQTVNVYKSGYKIPVYFDDLPPAARRLRFLKKPPPILPPLSWIPRVHRRLSVIGWLNFSTRDIDIHKIPPNETCEINDNPIDIAQRLKSMGFSGKMELVGFCEDLTTRTHQSKPIEFDIDWWVSRGGQEETHKGIKATQSGSG